MRKTHWISSDYYISIDPDPRQSHLIVIASRDSGVAILLRHENCEIASFLAMTAECPEKE